MSGLTVEKDLRGQLEQLQKERLNEKTNTLEGHIVKVVCELYFGDEPVAFGDIWDGLVKDLGGKLDDKKPNKMDTPEFGEITKQKIGYRLREVLSGKKGKNKAKDDTRVYDFNFEKLSRIAKKYGCNLADKRTSGTSCGSVQGPNSENRVEEKSIFSEKKPVLEAEIIEKQVQTPAEVVQLIRSSANWSFEDLVIKAKEVVRLNMDFGIENCVSCGTKGRPDWQVTLFDDSWGFLCGSCGEELSNKLSNRD